jgi:hypothetical protein
MSFDSGKSSLWQAMAIPKEENIRKHYDQSITFPFRFTALTADPQLEPLSTNSTYWIKLTGFARICEISRKNGAP